MYRHLTLLVLLYSLSILVIAQDTTFYSSYTQGTGLGNEDIIYELNSSNKDTILRYFISNNEIAIQGKKLNNRMEGEIRKFYSNGQLYELAMYYQGSPVDTIRRWHKNGVLMGEFLTLPKDEETHLDQNEKILSCFDSTGQQTAQNGNGEVFISDPLTTDYQQGIIENGLKSGTWQGQKFNIGFEEIYHNGVLVSGISNQEKEYTELQEFPRFPGGQYEYYKFLRETLIYPIDARIKGIQGTVMVYFVVNSDGNLSHLRVVQGIGESCDEEAIRVFRNSPKWIPGKSRGQPVGTAFIQSITFKL